MDTCKDSDQFGKIDAGKGCQARAFEQVLLHHDRVLTRLETTQLQVNLGFRCNLACNHCHVEASPDRSEVMGEETMEQVIAYVARAGFSCVDFTGGAPELVPGVARLIEGIRPLSDRLVWRTNLSALAEGPGLALVPVLLANRVSVVASLPSLDRSQADSQRGQGSFEACIAGLEQLNRVGYGRPGTGLQLDLVVNPTGAFMPPDQAQTEQRYRERLRSQWGIEFDSLYCFANVSLGRFRAWLERSGKLLAYEGMLRERFDPGCLNGVMCRSMLSVDWRGNLYDCDFNLAVGLPLGRTSQHVSQAQGPPALGSPIAVGDHCFGCTAGSGFT